MGNDISNFTLDYNRQKYEKYKGIEFFVTNSKFPIPDGVDIIYFKIFYLTAEVKV